MEHAAHSRIKPSFQTDLNNERHAVGTFLDSWPSDMDYPLTPKQRMYIGSPLHPASVSLSQCESIGVETKDAHIALDVQEESSYFALQDGGGICQHSEEDTIPSISNAHNSSNDLPNNQIEDASITELEKGGDAEPTKCWGDEEDIGECRICHLALNGEMEVIHLGCLCKEDLSCAHHLCAETWFKTKGDRTCEVCGSIAQNVIGMYDTNFMDHWNDIVSSSTTPVESSCWQSQPLCNLLLVCLVVAFMLPWLFHMIRFEE